PEPGAAQLGNQRHQVHRARPRRHRRARAGHGTGGVVGAGHRARHCPRCAAGPLPGIPTRPAGSAPALLELGVGIGDLPQTRRGDGRGAARGLAPEARHPVSFRVGVAPGRCGVRMRSRSDLPTLAVVALRSAWPAAAARIAEPFGARRVALRVPPRAPRTTLAMRQGMATTLPWLVEPAPALSWVEREGPRRWLN